ncbi:MAG: hypothetical protein IJ719_20965 [Clostridia bacterium]|nr:hypothetical protein [Clostridia bacterium]
MTKLSQEKIEQILQETPKSVDLPMILRSVYVRYLSLFEKYFADIDALNDDVIADFKNYHEETKSLVKYYFMDIPQDVCREISEFDEKYTEKLLGTDWHKVLSDGYEEYSVKYKEFFNDEKSLKAEFTEDCIKAFYEAMEDVFRDGFGTASKAGEKMLSGLSNLLFGGKKE